MKRIAEDQVAFPEYLFFSFFLQQCVLVNRLVGPSGDELGWWERRGGGEGGSGRKEERKGGRKGGREGGGYIGGYRERDRETERQR